MSILETANMLNDIAQEIAIKRGITVQEAWEEALEELKDLQEEQMVRKILGGIRDELYKQSRVPLEYFKGCINENSN